MGSCLSKKDSTTPTTASATATHVGVSAPPPDPNKCDAHVEKKAVEGGEESVKKEVFVIKHRKSHSHDTFPQEKGDGDTCTSELAPHIRSKTTTTPTPTTTCSNSTAKDGGAAGAGSNSLDNAATTASLSSSSCTKEEVDAILIQCGRLSRSSSGKAASSARKYSGSKRSYDFDHRDNDDDDNSKKGNGNDDEMPRRRSSRASSQERRRTPSRERSGSRDRGSSGSGSGTGRRVSRSPARRSQTPSNAATSATVKMVSVPATVSSLVMDKSNNGGGGAEPGTNGTVKRISVKRNVGAASPRSQSPAKPNYANAKVSNENHQQQASLSRSSSRKADRSPFRRNPLSDIDTNSLPIQQLPQQPSHKTANNFVSQGPMQKPNVEDMNNCNSKVVVQGTNTKSSSRVTQENKAVAVSCRAKEQHQQQIAEAPIKPKGMSSYVESTIMASGAESLKPQTLTRSRSSRRSRDLDLNPETLLNPAASYTTLLLEDIQNFHQKTNNASFSLPPCVTKACSILEAVADLNSCTPLHDHSNKFNNLSLSGQKGLEAREPFMESELEVGDDIMEPSLHKYVTVRRGTVGGEDMEEQESSGSNSFVGGQQHGGSSSCSYSSWEPNSASSVHCWTSRSNSREEDLSPLGFQSQRHASGCDVEEAPRRSSAKKRDSHHQRTEITHGSRGVHTHPTPTLAAAAAAST